AAVSGVLALGMALAGGVASADVVRAGPNQCSGQQDCGPHHDRGRPSPRYDGHHDRTVVIHKRVVRRDHGPRVGERIHGRRIVDVRHYRHLPPPPRHQHYEIYDNHVVRVDNNTLAIVAVTGLAAALLATN
ncbi:hypothetical protein FGG78_24630, partial [Thioclava sp. BHET1]